MMTNKIFVEIKWEVFYEIYVSVKRNLSCHCFFVLIVIRQVVHFQLSVVFRLLLSRVGRDVDHLGLILLHLKVSVVIEQQAVRDGGATPSNPS